MAENSEPTPGTSPSAPAGTSTEPKTPAEATPPKATAPAEATPAEEKTVTLKESDYKKLVSQRDKGNNEAAAQGDFVLQLAKEREIDGFLDTNKEKYSYVKREDIMHLDDPSELSTEADRIQRRFEDVVQEALMNVGQVKPPELSPEDKAKQLKDIKKNKPKDGFQRMLALQTSSD